MFPRGAAEGNSEIRGKQNEALAGNSLILPGVCNFDLCHPSVIPYEMLVIEDDSCFPLVDS